MYSNNSTFDAELNSQAYTLGVEVGLGENLVLTPSLGIWNSELEIAELVELENDVGLALGIDGSYNIYEIKEGILLSLIGSYNYHSSEIDTVKIKPLNLVINNPIRNDLVVHSYEFGAKVDFDILPVDLVPYFGIVYSDSFMDLDANLSFAGINIDADASDNFGIRIGVVGKPTEHTELRLDTRFIDETAIMGSFVYRF